MSEGSVSVLRSAKWDLNPGEGLVGFRGKGDETVAPANTVSMVLVERLSRRCRYLRSGNRGDLVHPIVISEMPLVWAQTDGEYKLYVGGKWRTNQYEKIVWSDGDDGTAVAGQAVDLYASRQGHPFKPCLSYKEDPKKAVAHRDLFDWVVKYMVNADVESQVGYFSTGLDKIEFPGVFCHAKSLRMRRGAVDRRLLDLVRDKTWTIEGAGGTMSLVRGTAERHGEDIELRYEGTSSQESTLRSKDRVCWTLESLIEESFPKSGIVVELEPTIPEGRRINVGPTRTLFRPKIPEGSYSTIQELEGAVGPEGVEMLRYLATLVDHTRIEGNLFIDARLVSSPTCPWMRLNSVPAVQKVRGLPESLIPEGEDWLFLDPSSWTERVRLLTERVEDIISPPPRERQHGVSGGGASEIENNAPAPGRLAKRSRSKASDVSRL